MTVTSYSYDKLCDPGRLSYEIAQSAIVTALDHIETTSSPANTTVYMKAALSGGDETILDGLVTAHVNEPLPEDAPVLITTGAKDTTLGREVITISAFAVNTDYEVKAKGFSGTATKNTTTNLEWKVNATEDRYIHGLRFILKNHAEGDTAKLQFVDVDGVLAPAGTVLKEFGDSWNFDDTRADQGREGFNYIARIPAGIYMRVVYVSTGTTDDVKVKVNAYLHKKVI